MTVSEKFGENLMLIRRRAKLSQESLGFAAGLHRTEIGQLERGDRLPRIDTLLKLAGALSVPPGELLKGIAWLPGQERSGRFLSSESGVAAEKTTPSVPNDIRYAPQNG